MIPFFKKKTGLKTRIGLSVRQVFLTTTLISASALTGCSILEPYKAPLTQGTVVSEEHVELIQTGLTKQQTRELFGPPFGQDPFNPNHWDYVYYSSNEDLHSKNVNRLSIYFDQDGMIESWTLSDKPLTIKR